jgi:hypothetical protein
MRFALFGFALCAAVNALPAVDTGSLEPRQQHPAGPGRQALINLLGKNLYHEVSLDLHQVAIAVAHLEREVAQLTISLDPSLAGAIHQLTTQVDTLEADLVSIGFNS